MGAIAEAIDDGQITQLATQVSELGDRLEAHRTHVDRKFDAVVLVVGGIREELALQRGAREAVEEIEARRVAAANKRVNTAAGFAVAVSAVAAVLSVVHL